MSDMNKTIACQMSYLPLKTDNIEEKVKNILNVIKNFGLEYKTGAWATEINGPKEQVFALIREVFDAAQTLCADKRSF
uniref:Thiamine-binding protein n=1 Tax=Candidatus Desulfatibia profunda TaxID=2841695 RepID=A0A8J6TGG6_9BACT|nr:thiamine-binding protein [Candidatus Desulfatibia profunda]